MSDSVLIVDASVYLARRFHILRQLKSIISWPPGAPRRRRELPAIAEYLIPPQRDWFEVWGLSGCVGLCQFGYAFTMALTRRAVVAPIRDFFGASFSRLVGDSHNVISVNEFVRCNID